MSGFIGSGDIYFDRLDDNGESTGYLLVGNAVKLELKPESETKDRVSRQKDTYGQVLDSVAIPKPTQLSISIDELQKENLAIALLGTLAETAAQSGVVTAANFTVSAVNVWIQLPHTHISDLVVKDVTNATSYAVGEDYLFNERVGLLYIMSDGAIGLQDVLHLSYDYAIPAQSKIEGSTKTTVKARIKLDGVNRVNGQACVVDIDEAILSPKSAIDFLSDDFLKLDLEGVCRTVSGQTSPYRVRLG